MVYAVDLKSMTEKFVGSSPTPGTDRESESCAGKHSAVDQFLLAGGVTKMEVPLWHALCAWDEKTFAMFSMLRVARLRKPQRCTEPVRFESHSRHKTKEINAKLWATIVL